MPAQVEFDTIPQLFRRLCTHYEGQDRPMLRYKERGEGWHDLTWDEVEARAEALAGALHKSGVRKGDRVALLSENRPEWAITDFGAQLIGGVNVSIYTSLPPSKVAYILRDSGATACIVSVPVQRKKIEEIFDECPQLDTVIVMSELPDDPPSYMKHWDEALATGREYWDAHEGRLGTLADEVTPDDPSAIIYTSGTTGEPKGVVLTNRNFCSNVKAALQRVPFGEDDHHLSFLPLAHAFERTAGHIAVLAAGATISYAESVEAVSQNLKEVQPTVMISVPRMFEKVYNRVTKKVGEGGAVKQKLFEWAVRTGEEYAEAEQGDGAGPLLKAQKAVAHRLVFSTLHEKLGGNLRFAVSGGAALPEEIGTFFQAAGVTIIEGYGLTETAPVLSVNPLDAPRYGTVGHVLPGVSVAIQSLDDETRIAEVNGNDYPTRPTTEEGEILVKGPNVMEGYWERPEETRAAFDPDGWYHSGDVGRFEDGYLKITDRLKHMIVSRGGKNIYPGPIEETFKTKTWIDQIIVIGEDRPFLSALVVPDFDSLRMRARDHGIDESAYSDEELIEHEDVQEAMDQIFTAFNHEAAAHEKIRNFRLLPEPFTVEDGTLTPTLKLRRNVITERYADRIDAMYEEFRR
ncbi:long-chain fatty acid--CoA ligase [Salinibacter sp. 10B]|uniref:AMP-dependent synthetase/ligase n=1 Tax=Salinibacter sp. 10B TaxID=1923971 RepID=UPI000CF3813D|nr:long-chain fatty acid--CoA ligase [Salinibacter sp. 10B]PQJ34456.1 long-chain fatty acid--CoA ligase [Salinibacter sp. 10B]